MLKRVVHKVSLKLQKLKQPPVTHRTRFAMHRI